jgi:KUP system potassium uptake protein
LVIDLAFWGANLVKIPDGGWFPLVVAALVFTLLTTWKHGRHILAERMSRTGLPLEALIAQVATDPPPRVPGTAVFMAGNQHATPPALLHNLKHNRVLHEQVICLTVETEEVPHVPADKRVSVQERDHGVYSVVLLYGFMEDVDVPRDLAQLDGHNGLSVKRLSTTYFLGREKLIASRAVPGMAHWRERLFALMSRNARGATAFFRLPPDEVVELGTQVEI